MNESNNTEYQSGSQYSTQDTQTTTVMEVDYSEQLADIYELQCWSFGLFAVFVGLFISYGMVAILKTFLR